MCRIVALFIALITAVVSESAHANSYACRPYESALRSADYQVTRAENDVFRAEDSLYRSQDQVNRRIASYQYQIDLARYNQSRVNSISSGNTARCIVRTIFYWRSYSCVGSSVFAARNQRLQAQYRVNSAVSRYNSYVTYANGYLYRQAERVTLAKERLELAKTRRAEAAIALNQCLNSNVEG